MFARNNLFASLKNQNKPTIKKISTIKQNANTSLFSQKSFGISCQILLQKKTNNIFQKRSIADFRRPEWDIKEGIEPLFSKKAMDYHYFKELAEHGRKLNELVAGTPYQGAKAESIAKTAHQKDTAIYNHAAEMWNHMFFFDSIIPGGKEMSPALEELLTIHFGSTEEFKNRWVNMADAFFGSGWLWFCDVRGSLGLFPVQNAGCPLTFGEDIYPLLGLDLWEHAYYLDYKNNKRAYAENWLRVVNWEKVAERLAAIEQKREALRIAKSRSKERFAVPQYLQKETLF